MNISVLPLSRFWTALLSALLTLAALTSSRAQTDNLDLTLLEGLQADGSYTVLLSLIDTAGLTDALTSGEYTLLAPDDEVFEDLDPAALEALQNNPEALATVLQAHVIEGVYGINDLQDLSDEGVVSLQGELLDFDTTLSGLTVNGAGFDSDDVGANFANGVIHEIDDLILPESLQTPGALEDALIIVTTEAEDSTTDVEQVDPEGADVDEADVDPEEATDDVSEVDVDETVDETDGAEVEQVNPEGVEVDEADVDAEEATDSVAEKDVDEIVTVAGESVEQLLETLQADGRFTELVAALEGADLSDLETFTLFAPTDDAFTMLDEDALEDTDINTVLLYHLLPNRVLAENLVGTEPGNDSAEAGERLDGLATTVEGRDLMLTLNEDGSYTLNEEAATVIEANIAADDETGFVIHAIDAVLMPQEMME